MKSTEGMRAFETAILSDEVHITVANINWKNYLTQFIEVPSWLSAFAQVKVSQDSLKATLEIADPNERKALVKNFVIDCLKTVLGLSTSQPIDEKKGFFDMGLDSLMAIELKNRLQSGLGKSAILPTTAIFNHANIEKMTSYIGQLLKIESLQIPHKQEPAISYKLDEPIAIIGLSCRFPGGANTPEAYWTMLESGVDAISEIPANRWDRDQFYDPDPTVPGKMITKLGGFLNIDVSEFDAAFFKISPKEAEFLIHNSVCCSK